MTRTAKVGGLQFKFDYAQIGYVSEMSVKVTLVNEMKVEVPDTISFNELEAKLMNNFIGFLTEEIVEGSST